MKKERIRMKKAVKTFVAVALISIAITAAANATILGTVNITGHNNTLSDIGQLFGGGLNGGTYYTGIYSWTNSGGTTDLAAHVPGWGFCIELTQGPYSGWQNLVTLEDAPQPVTSITPMGTTKANYIRELWGRDFDPTWITNPTAANKRLAEAFGACLWEIIYETANTWNVKTGTAAGFHCTGVEQADLANTWLSQLNGDTNYFSQHLAATSTDNGQDYLVYLPTPVPPVPEPATICILGLGALSLIRRKK